MIEIQSLFVKSLLLFNHQLINLVEETIEEYIRNYQNSLFTVFCHRKLYQTVQKVRLETVLLPGINLLKEI